MFSFSLFRSLPILLCFTLIMSECICEFACECVFQIYCLTLFLYSICLLMFLCPFDTITVNKCTYLKNLLHYTPLLFTSRALVHTRTLWRCEFCGGVGGNCRMNEVKLLVLFGCSSSVRRRLLLYYRINVVVGVSFYYYYYY